MPLRELLAVRAEDVRDVRVDRELGAERLQDQDLLRRVRDVVVAADHVRDPVEPVLDRRGEVVGRAPVGADEDDVLELLVRELDPALDGVVPGGRALVRHPEADRALVLVGLALRDEAARLLLAALDPVELEGRLAVPVDPEPAQRPLDLLDRLRDLAARVGVLDPQQALAAAPAREQPVEEEGADAADVEEAGRARRHADADAHGLARLSTCCSAPTAQAGSRARSTTRSRSAPTPCSSSRRARARGASPSTRRRISPGSASGATRRASARCSCTRSTSATSRRRTGRSTPRAARRCARPSTPPCAIEADGVVFHVGSHLGAGFKAGVEALRAGAPRGARPLLRARPGSCSRTRPAPAARSAARSTSSRSSSTRSTAIRGSASASTPATSTSRASTSAIRTAVAAVLAEVDDRIGLDRLRALHVNDAAGAARLEPRPARERARGRARRAHRRLPRAPGRPEPPGGDGDARARTATAPTRPRCRSCATCTPAGRNERAHGGLCCFNTSLSFARARSSASSAIGRSTTRDEPAASSTSSAAARVAVRAPGAGARPGRARGPCGSRDAASRAPMRLRRPRARSRRPDVVPVERDDESVDPRVARRAARTARPSVPAARRASSRFATQAKEGLC